ncbi:SCN11A [Symbiodinium natans]|uniref:SCN11A protein n=1 Tax=Symbiodinium natans TaxID=878477 RepID=A0A812UWZ1_9DINO|nr:SCN11A [Symbiodinium natans]
MQFLSSFTKSLSPTTSTGNQSQPSQSSSGSSEVEKLFADAEQVQDRLVGVIVTISASASYDHNFREVRPETVPGEKVSTYSVDLFAAPKLQGFLSGQELEGLWAELVADIRSVAADSVTFNWECCGACSDKGFCTAQGTPPTWSLFSWSAHSPTMSFIAFALQSGFSVMCSDFSLKALLSEWSDELLGPNPFVRLPGSCDQQFQLEFFPQHLTHEDVPQQLQVVGELCTRDGKAVVKALGDTILYTLNPRRRATDRYTLKVLTVVTAWTGSAMAEAMKCEIEHGDMKKRGAAGHVALSYPSGGQLITSMGHWIELTRINTSAESIMEVAARNFGQAEVSKHQTKLSSARNEFERQRCLQEVSKEMIQKSVPSAFKSRTKY